MNLYFLVPCGNLANGNLAKMANWNYATVDLYNISVKV